MYNSKLEALTVFSHAANAYYQNRLNTIGLILAKKPENTDGLIVESHHVYTCREIDDDIYNIEVDKCFNKCLRKLVEHHIDHQEKILEAYPSEYFVEFIPLPECAPYLSYTTTDLKTDVSLRLAAKSSYSVNKHYLFLESSFNIYFKPEKTTMAKSMKLGGGGRFQKLTNKLQAQGKSAGAAKAIAASAGRKKYGAPKMAKMAATGRARKMK